MKQPDRVVDCVARALKPGGRFVAEMGGYRNVVTATDAFYKALSEEGVQREAVNFPWYFPRTSTQVRRLEDAGFDVEYVRYFRRPTPLENCENGIADWYRMFGKNFIDAVPEGAEERVIARAAALCEKTLCPNGAWAVDYTRLRFVARWLDE
jgi:SAM-dependent methyltransferase